MATEQAQAKAMLLMLKGAMSDLPEEDRKAVESIACTLRGIVASNGDNGEAAFTLVALERGAAAED